MNWVSKNFGKVAMKLIDSLGRPEHGNRDEEASLDIRSNRIRALGVQERCPKSVHSMHSTLIEDISRFGLGDLEQADESGFERRSVVRKDGGEDGEDTVGDTG